MPIQRTGSIYAGPPPTNAPGAPSPAGIWSPTLDNAMVDFDRDVFTRALHDKGYDVEWQRASLCPRRGGLAPKDHPVNCTVCNGGGFIYYGITTTRMLMTGMRMEQGYFAYGRWDGGQAMVTALPEFRLSYWDRLIIKNGQGRFNDIVRRQPSGVVDKLKYPALCVEHLTWVDRQGALQVFAQDTDFVITEDGFISWLRTTDIPDTGDYYSVTYRYRPRYVVTDLVHQHRESTVGGRHYEFPVQAVAKLEFIIRDESEDAPEVIDPSPFPR